jgi:hypothetical protein
MAVFARPFASGRPDTHTADGRERELSVAIATMCSAHATANATHPLHASAVGSGPSAAARPTAVRTTVRTRTGTAARDGATRLLERQIS